VIKKAPTPGQLAAMVGFALSVFSLLTFLWLQFGGTIPLKPEKYRFKASFDEAALLVEQADVRMAGLDVGKVVDKELDRARGRTIATIELDRKFAPIPRDTRVLLRTKALLGETYVEMTPGTESAAKLEDGELLPRSAEQEAVQIDEIVSTFDEPTRRAFQGWVHELARAIRLGRGEDLNDAIGNLPGFVASGEDVLRVLDEEEPALRQLIRNSGRALAAVNEREGQFRELIVNANNFMGALASRNESLAEAVFVLPVFLDESKATLRRLREFAVDTRPLVRDLQPVADDLHPTLRDVGRLAPDLKALFRNLDPLIDESERNLPAAAEFIGGAEPVLEALHVYLPELNPILSFANYEQAQLADFITNGGGSLSATLPPFPGEGPRHYLRQYGVINARGAGINRTRPPYERGNAYPGPNYFTRARGLGIFEAFDCKPAGGEMRDPKNNEPPCFVAPRSLFDGRQFPRLASGDAPLRPPPPGDLGSEPATP
jgi:phospholipid/cholesterol/gamma-HCH transport system substrate-binding protein